MIRGYETASRDSCPIVTRGPAIEALDLFDRAQKRPCNILLLLYSHDKHSSQRRRQYTGVEIAFLHAQHLIPDAHCPRSVRGNEVELSAEHLVARGMMSVDILLLVRWGYFHPPLAGQVIASVLPPVEDGLFVLENVVGATALSPQPMATSAILPTSASSQNDCRFFEASGPWP